MKAFLSKINNIGGYKISFIVLLFFIIFSPPVIPVVNTTLVTAAVLGILIFVKYKGQISDALKSSKIMLFCLVFSLFLLYLALTTVVNFCLGNTVQLMHYVKLWYRFFLIVPMSAVICLYIVLRTKELSYSPEKLCMCIIIATMLQFVLAFSALLFPSVKSFFIDIIYKNTGDGYLDIPWVMARRGFGFSNSFLDSFGFGMGIVAALPLFILKPENKKILLLIPFLLLISILNVRTGLIIAFLGVLTALPHFFIVFKKSNKPILILTVITAFALLICLLIIVYLCNPVTLGWIIEDVSSIAGTVIPEASNQILPDAIASNSDTTTAQVLFSSRFWNIPLGLTLIFGSGHTIFGAVGFPNSDVGYINDLWMGGIVGTAILYSAFILIILQALKGSKKLSRKSLVVFLSLSFFVFQIKANAIAFNAGLIVFLMLLFSLISDKQTDPKASESYYKNYIYDGERVSVIVPVYGVEKELVRCIESILSQSYKNTEIILVDDGSPDNCGKICDGYAEKHTNIKVIHQNNKGLSGARNTALSKASGEYVVFVDGDDFLHPDYITALYSCAKEYDCDISVCGYTEYYNENKQIPKCVKEIRLFNGAEAVKDILTFANRIDVMAWNKLYKRELFLKNNIKYPENTINEDVATTYRLCERAEKTVCIPNPLYYYRKRNGSIMGQSFSKKRLELLEVVGNMEPTIKESPQYSREYEIFVFLQRLTLLNAMADSFYKDKELFKELLALIKSDYASLKGNPYFSIKNRLTVCLLKTGMYPFYILRKIYTLI